MPSKRIRTVTGVVLVASIAAVGVQSHSLCRVHGKLDHQTGAVEPLARAEQPSDDITGLDDRKTATQRGAFDSAIWDPREMEGMRSRLDEPLAGSLGRFDLDSTFREMAMPGAEPGNLVGCGAVDPGSVTSDHADGVLTVRVRRA